MAAKERFAHAADVEIMAFPQAGLLLEDGTVPLLEEALRAGATTIGGIDPCQLDRDPVRHLDIVFGLAEKYGVDVDIHLHEPGHMGVFSAELVFERTRALGMQGRVSLSHAYDLANVHPDVTARLVEQMAELDVAWATVAPASGGTQFDLARMTEAGIRVGLGEDGQRDYWSPYGNCDMLDRTWQLAFTHRLRKDRLIEHCAAIATIGGASIMDRTTQRLTSPDDRPGLAPGRQGRHRPGRRRNRHEHRHGPRHRPHRHPRRQARRRRTGRPAESGGVIPQVRLDAAPQIRRADRRAPGCRPGPGR